MDQYLLDRDKIILNPEYLYASPDRRAYLFFFYPEQGGGYREHIKELAGYLLEKSGDDAVLLRSVWRFCRLCSEKEPEPEALFRCLGEEGDRQAVQKEAIEAEAYSEKNDTEKAEAKGRKNKKENREVKKREDTGDDIGKYKEGNKRKNREKMIKKKAGILEKIKMFFKRWFDSQPYSEEEMWDEQDYAQNVKESAQFVYENPTELLYWDEQSASTPVLYCKEKKEKVPVTKFPFFIGMQNGVDYKPDFGGVSRLHLKLEKKGERYYITDLNSTNGTKLNGENLCPNEERQVVQGDFIWIAGLSYEFLEFDRAEKSW